MKSSAPRGHLIKSNLSNTTTSHVMLGLYKQQWRLRLRSQNGFPENDWMQEARWAV